MSYGFTVDGHNLPLSRISGSDLRDADRYVRENKYGRLGLKIE